MSFLIAGQSLPFATLIATTTPQDNWVSALVNCESEGSTTVKVLDTDGYYSYGLGQFHMKTWLTYGKNFGATKENIYDGILQKKVIKSMLDDGLENQWWTCSRKVRASLGEFPSS